MRKTTNLISAFLIGFYGVALLIDEPQMLKIKSIVFFIGFIIITVLNIIDGQKDRYKHKGF